MEVCAAITGRVPRCGLHLKENRKGQVLVRLVDTDPTLLSADVFYPVLGHLVGKLVQDRIPVVEGIPREVSKDQLKAFSAAAASSGSVALFHMIGVTPEASTVDEAFQGSEPEQVIDLDRADLFAAWQELSMVRGGKLDAVVLGCPHYSVVQLQQLAQMMTGERVHPDVQFVAITNRAAHCILADSDTLAALRGCGVTVMLDGCVLNGPVIKTEAKTIMTDSGKCAYYGPGMLGLGVAFGSTTDCVRSAIEGEVSQDESLWRRA
jgi:predicted aconitase